MNPYDSKDPRYWDYERQREDFRRSNDLAAEQAKLLQEQNVILRGQEHALEEIAEMQYQASLSPAKRAALAMRRRRPPSPNAIRAHEAVVAKFRARKRRWLIAWIVAITLAILLIMGFTSQ